MSKQFGNAFLKQPPHGGGHTSHKPDVSPARAQPPARQPFFTKIFRWRKPEGFPQEPDTVEVSGTFSHWQKLPLGPSGEPDIWQVTIENIPGNRTHHYMLLVNGQPVYDPNNDGLAIPHGPEEKQHQLTTDRGPRVFMLFAQTK
jgi:hypothetical protein